MLDLAPPGDIKAEILSLIQQDLRVHLLYHMPRHKNFMLDRSWLAAQTKLETAEVSQITSRFLQLGLWVMNAEGGVSIGDPKLDMFGGLKGEMSVPDYMTLASQILSELSEKGRCWYEFEMVPTTQDLKHEFLRKVFTALQELKEKSSKTPADTFVAWTNISLEVLGPNKGSGK